MSLYGTPVTDEEAAALEAEDEAVEADIERAREQQQKVDRVAFLRLKKEHGAHRVGIYALGRACFKPGWPTLFVMQTMDGIAKHRVEQMLGSNSPQKKAQGLKCAAVDALLYPDEPTFVAMCKVFQHLEGNFALASLELSRARGEAEGKG